jgi:hypothetical protein
MWGEKRVKGEEIIPNTLFKIKYLHQTDVYTVPKTQIYTQTTVKSVTNLRINRRQI